MNIIAIIVAASAMFVVGFLFHGPLFGRVWMKLANIHPTGKEKLSDMWKQMVQNWISNLVMAFVMSGAFWLIFSSPLMGGRTMLRGAICAAWLWLGFIVTSSSNEVIWMKRSYKLWLFDSIASLASVVAMGAILGGW